MPRNAAGFESATPLFAGCLPLDNAVPIYAIKKCGLESRRAPTASHVQAFLRLKRAWQVPPVRRWPPKNRADLKRLACRLRQSGSHSANAYPRRIFSKRGLFAACSISALSAARPHARNSKISLQKKPFAQRGKGIDERRRDGESGGILARIRGADRQANGGHFDF